MNFLLLVGGLTGLGVALVVFEFMPARPDLSAAMARLAGPGHLPAAPAVQLPLAERGAFQERLGAFLERHLRDTPGVRIPTQDLALIEKPVSSWFGEKAAFAILGLAFPTLLGALLAVAGISLPFIVPGGAALVLALVLWFGPDGDVKREAAEMRVVMAHAISAYLVATAMARLAGKDPQKALELAARGNSRVFARIREEIEHSNLTSTPSWDGLHALGVQLNVAELDLVADIMRLSGQEGANVYESLHARGRGLRASLLAKAEARAKVDSERIVAPMAMLGLLSLALLLVPQLLAHT